MVINKLIKKACALAGVSVMSAGMMFASCGNVITAAAAEDVITLRICNMEEYIDTGSWDDGDEIDLDSGTIKGVNSLVDDFEQWYQETYGKKVKVVYSTIGTNEELYNMLTLGDEYDLVCPSEYMIMKLMAEGWLEPYSQSFFDKTDDNNYYINGVSKYIQDIFDNNKIDGESWSKYAAGYMWGITGIVYNPEAVTQEDASTWSIINNPKFKRQITIKDNVRDSMFAAIAAVKKDILTDSTFTGNSDYRNMLAREMNDTSDKTLSEVLEYLQAAKDNVYSFETDSAKADMISQKVMASYQWSGDAVYTIDQAEKSGLSLNFAVPEECTNLYFDGWVMLKSGIAGDEQKKHAAESFINFISIPENVVRNMYYIGYTSVISGGSSDVIYDYIKWNYEASEDETDVVEYPLGYFFSGDASDKKYVLKTSADKADRQLLAQYPSEEILSRSAVMEYFDNEENGNINQMWINVRCYNINNIPLWIRILLGVTLVCGVVICVYLKITRRDDAE